MVASFVLVLKDWFSWQLIVLVVLVIAICRKDRVRAVVRLSPFQFSLEARNISDKLRRKARTNKG
jgi:hypothetical protein